jgi:hypothetical protein
MMVMQHYIGAVVLTLHLSGLFPEGESPTGEWGPEQDGLRTRLVRLTDKPVVGQPLKFRLEMKNFGKVARHYDPQNAAAFRVMSVKKADGEADPYAGPSYQTAGGPKPIKPGETVVLWDDYDVAEQFLLAEPGKYVVQTRATRAIPPPPIPGLRDAAESAIPASNSLTVELAPGKLPELKTMFVRLREILPKEKAWRIAMSGRVIFFTHSPTNLKKDVTTIQLWFDEKEHPPGYSLGEGANKTPVERVGKTPLGFAYMTATAKAAELWPEFRAKIIAMLRPTVQDCGCDRATSQKQTCSKSAASQTHPAGTFAMRWSAMIPCGGPSTRSARDDLL